jgi:hypothetical protein
MSGQTGLTTKPVAIVSYEDSKDLCKGEFEGKIAVLLENTGITMNLLQQGFIKTKTLDGKQYIFIEESDKALVERAATIGSNFLTKVLSDVCIKGVTNPGKILNVLDSKVILPSNLEAAADTQIHKLMRIYYELGYEIDVSDETIKVPDISSAWTSNITYCLDQIYSIVRSLKMKNFSNKLPSRPKSKVIQALVYVMTFKYANANNMSQYLRSEVRKGGNLSETAFCDLVKGWSVSLEGNILGRIAAASYQLCGIISRMEGFEQILCRDHFMSGLDLRRAIAPARQVVVKEGNKTKVETKGDVNVLKFDSIRFLTPAERARVRNFNRSLDLENKIQEFDKTPIQDRNYPEFESYIKELIRDNENKYFKLRRLARDRLYAIKEVRKEARQNERISDGEFHNDSMIAVAITLANSVFSGTERGESLVNRIGLNIVDSVFLVDETTEKIEAETN